MPSRRRAVTNHPGAVTTEDTSAVSTGNGSSWSVHTGWSAGSASPSIPLAAQYGDAGPE